MAGLLWWLIKANSKQHTEMRTKNISQKSPEHTVLITVLMRVLLIQKSMLFLAQQRTIFQKEEPRHTLNLSGAHERKNYWGTHIITFFMITLYIIGSLRTISIVTGIWCTLQGRVADQMSEWGTSLKGYKVIHLIVTFNHHACGYCKASNREIVVLLMNSLSSMSFAH